MKSYLKLLPFLLIGITEASSYTQKYDSTFGMGLKGVYAWSDADDNKLAPNLAGFLLDLHSNIGTGDVFHEVSLTTGYLGSPQKDRASANFVEYHDGGHSNDVSIDAHAKHKHEMIPLMLGYAVNVPIVQDKVYLYLGAKTGVAFNYGKLTSFGEERYSTGTVESYSQTFSDTQTDWIYSFNAGIRVALTSSTDFTLGYELFVLKDLGNTYTYHAIEAGLSWTF